MSEIETDPRRLAWQAAWDKFELFQRDSIKVQAGKDALERKEYGDRVELTARLEIKQWIENQGAELHMSMQNNNGPVFHFKPDQGDIAALFKLTWC